MSDICEKPVKTRVKTTIPIDTYDIFLDLFSSKLKVISKLFTDIIEYVKIVKYEAIGHKNTTTQVNLPLVARRGIYSIISEIEVLYKALIEPYIA